MSETRPLPVPRAPRRPLAGLGPVSAWGLKHVVRWPKVLAIALGAVAVGVVIAVAIGESDNRVRALAKILDRGVLAFALPLLTLLLAADGFSFEVSQRTLVYHLVRPVRRSTIFLARVVAGWVPATAVGLLFLVVVVAGARVELPTRVWLSLPVTAAVSAVALGAVYYVLASVLRHGLVIGLLYTFVVEGFLSSVPGSMQKLSVMFHVRSLHHRLVGDALPEIRPPTTGSILLSRLERVTDTEPVEAAVILLAITVVVLAVGVWIVKRRDYSLRE